MRSHILLLAADGLSNTSIAQQLSVTLQTVGKWRQRYLDQGVDGLLDEPRPGTSRKLADKDVDRVLALTLESTPADATHWSTRSLAKRPWYHLHFTSTSASWLNLVERWFAAHTEKQLRRGVQRSTKELKNAIPAFINNHNKDSKPFVWHKTADQILDSIACFCTRTLVTGH